MDRENKIAKGLHLTQLSESNIRLLFVTDLSSRLEKGELQFKSTVADTRK